MKKFFVTMVSHARNIFFRANEDAETWAKTAMSPLATQIKERKQLLEDRLTTMQKVKSSREKLGENIQRIEKELAGLEKQLTTIKGILTGINQPLPGHDDQSTPLQVVPAQSSNIATG